MFDVVNVFCNLGFTKEESYLIACELGEDYVLCNSPELYDDGYGFFDYDMYINSKILEEFGYVA